RLQWSSELRKRILCLLVFCVSGVAAVAQDSHRFNFNVGGGLGGATGEVGKFTGISYHGVAGGGLNLSPNFGVKAEYMYFNLGFDDSVKIDQQVAGATGKVQSATLNLFFAHSLQGKWGVYGIGGGGWYQRSVDASSEFLAAGTICQPAWRLWGITCTNRLVEPSQTLSSHSVSAGGYNFGGGL